MCMAHFSLRGAALLLVAGSAACAQDCYLATTPAIPTVSLGSSPLSVYDSVRSRILIVEQSPGSGLTKLYMWLGSTWELISANGPPLRTLAAMAYDPTRNRVVLHGGQQGTLPSAWFPPEVWEWDGQSWTSLPVTPGPFGRRRHAMVYDAARQNMFMFGGLDNLNQLSDQIWLWDGAAWSSPNPSVRPAPRQNPSLTYNAQRNSVLLLGGFDASFAPLNDFWEWDGQAWTRLPDPPVTGAFIHNPVRGKSLVSGLQAWEYDGAWTFIAQFGPQAFGGPSAAPPIFDASAGRVVFAHALGLTHWNPNGSIVAPWTIAHPGGGAFPAGQSVWLSAQIGGTAPFQLQWFKGGVPVANGGNVSGANSPIIMFSVFTQADAGTYHLRGSNSCGSFNTNSATLSVFTPPPCGGSACYANCDQSTGCPALTANDFLCYLNKFVSGHPFANCDGSTGNPTLTAGDYQCFLNKFAAGCS